MTSPVIPAKAGIQTASATHPDSAWIPAFAGMTERGTCAGLRPPSTMLRMVPLPVPGRTG
jgi:hypothetical protein